MSTKTATKQTPFGLSEKILPRLGKYTQIVRYESCTKGQKSPIKNQTDVDSDITLPGEYTFVDIHEENPSLRSKFIRNIASTYWGTNKITGDPEMQEKVSGLELTEGSIEVDVSRDYPKFIFLEFHPLNESNQYRDKRIKPVFRRVTRQRETVHDRNLHFDLVYEAIGILKRMNFDQLRRAYTSLKDPNTGNDMFNAQGATSDQIKYDLRLYASKWPRQIILLEPDSDAIITMYIEDGQRKGMLNLDTDGKVWILDGEDVFNFAVGQDPKEDFMKFLKEDNKDGKKIWNKLKNIVNDEI